MNYKRKRPKSRRAGESGRTAEELLKDTMSNLSESYWCAGWLMDIEYQLWDAVIGKKVGPFTPEEVAKLKYLSDRCGGWIVWENEEKNQKFVPLERWLKRYESYKDKKTGGN